MHLCPIFGLAYSLFTPLFSQDETGVKFWCSVSWNYSFISHFIVWIDTQLGMCEQAKSLSRETYQVSITLMVARRDSYRDFHKEGDCDCVLFQDMDRKWFAVNGVCRQFTQDKVSTLHLHQGHIELQKNCLHFIFPPKQTLQC